MMLHPNLEVLVVNRNAAVRRTLGHFLCTGGVRKFREFGDYQDALERLMCKQADLVIAESTLPDLDGVVLYEAFRQHAGLKDIPFLFLTTTTEEEQLAQKSGAQTCLRQPLTLQRLETGVARALKLR